MQASTVFADLGFPTRQRNAARCRACDGQSEFAVLLLIAFALAFGQGLLPAIAHAAYTKNLMSDSSIAAGSDHTFALHDGVVKGWGYNRDGRLGSGSGLVQQLQPTAVANLTQVTMIAAGQSHTLALKKDGTVWAWGTNAFGQLGDGTMTTRLAPVQVLGLPPIKAIGAGAHFSFAISPEGDAYGWGRNDDFQLGLGVRTAASTPQRISTLRNITKITGGRGHGLAIDSSRRVWAWGLNHSGQAGPFNGTRKHHTTPIMLFQPTAVTHVSAGWEHSLARDTEGNAWAWGSNHRGQLGQGRGPGNSDTPVQLTGLTNVVSVAAGQYHNLAVTSYGNVWAWGSNENGQLGSGTRRVSLTPIRVSRVHDFVVTIAAGNEHSLAADMHGQLFAWGNNVDGRLGTGAVDLERGPVKALFRYEYKVLVLMVSRVFQASWPGVEGSMAKLTSDIGRMSFGKVVLGVDYASYVANQALFDLCAQTTDPDVQADRIKQWVLDQAYAAGIDLSRYLHFVIQPNSDLQPTFDPQPNCIPRGNTGDFTNVTVTSTPVTLANVGVYKARMALFGTDGDFSRFIHAHEFLHGYGSSQVGHNQIAACTVGTTAYLPRSDHTALTNPDCRDGYGQLVSPMNVMGISPGRIAETDLRFNENGVYKDWWHWTPPDAVQQVPLPMGTYTYNLYPADDSTTLAGQTYGVKVDVRGPVPASYEQAFFLEYRKQAPQGAVNGIPDYTTRPGVYVYLRERLTNHLTQTPVAYSLRAVKVGQLDHPDFVQGVSTLPTSGVIELETGVTVELISISPSYATVRVQIYP
jgi:alpha-tubulin suppressor-like RCC1 family protein